MPDSISREKITNSGVWPLGRIGQIACAIVLVCVMLAAYRPALRGGYIWDDDFYVTGNRTLRDSDGLRQIWLRPGSTPQYYPLVFTTFWVEYRLWGLQPFGYHLTNVLLHAANALLVVAMLRRMGQRGAWIAGAIFALHPVQVESVAWITERKNTLSLFFALLALLSYMRFSPIGGVERSSGRWFWYGIALACFCAALFSKTVTCSLPAVILILNWWKRGKIGLRDVAALIPFFALGLGFAWVTVAMERQHVGAEALKLGLSPVDRVLIAGRAFWFYLSKLAVPRDLTFIYARWEISASVAWQYAFPVAAAVLLAVLWGLRARIGRGALVIALLFGGILLPALGFVDVYPFRYSWVADHFQYHASIAAIAGGAWLLARRMGNKGSAIAAGALVCLFAALTFRQAGMYRSIETLWRETIARNPSAWMAYTNLGNLYISQNRFADAQPLIQQAMVLKPDHPLALNALAYIALHEGRFGEARDLALRAIASPEPPRAEIFNNLGLAHQGLNDAKAAIEAFRRALELQPNLIMALTNLSELMIKLGDGAAATRYVDAALAERPISENANLQLMKLLVRLGRLADAERCALAALRANPHAPTTAYQYASLLALQGKQEAAREAAERLVRMKPDFPDALSLYGSMLSDEGKDEEALVPLRKAVELAPEHLEARFNLARALMKLQRNIQAIEQLQEIIKLQPGDREAQELLRQLQARR